ncbi:carbohydrate-selective porin, OprB family [mine drainage metagenome]|uniref:Carbohydrate-selective porin, OprB family n=1 Tax=mine drainage metagenome TaxID=410659 RepID=A0A1J5T662_9ZZZZ
MRFFRIIMTLLCAVFCIKSFAQSTKNIINRINKKDSVADWTVHFQNTTVTQLHPGFAVKYSGINSLEDGYEIATSNTTTIAVGRKLWKNAFFIFDQETTGGGGLSKTKGLAGFPNGEIYRVGASALTPFVARAYLQQIIPLKNSSFENQSSDINQFAGKIATSRLVITAGKFCITDFFDDNKYNHDARSQFLNWSLMAQGAWDFPADVRGYTTGIVVELIKPTWALRLASVEVPKIANALPMEWKWNGANSETVEFEKHWKTKNNLSGTIRTNAFVTFSRAPFYKDAIAAMAVGDSSLSEIITGNTEGTKYYGAKYGFGINLEQELNRSIGLFARYSWNDGKTASWAFTEIDKSLQAGIEINGNDWKRKKDVLGIAVVVNGLSDDHKNYLKAGGYGFIIGDGNLNYGAESVFETYYRFYIASFVQLSIDYQIANNPAYNKDRRGPVHITSIRLHFEL